MDRPFQGSGYEAEDIQTDEEASRIDMRSFYDSFSVGVSRATDFSDAEFVNATVEFAKSPRGGWDAKFVATLKQGAQKPGSIILVIPKRARDISPVVLFLKASPHGPTVKMTLPFRVSQQGDDRIVRLSYTPKKMDVGRQTKQTTRQGDEEAARIAGQLTLGVGFHMPSLRDRRLGWGEKEVTIVYSPVPAYKDFVPLVRGTAKKGPHAIARIPLRITLLYDADQNSITTSPEAKATMYNSQSWDATSTDQQQIFQAVRVNRRWRWRVDHAPDVLFLIIGILLGDWLATKESSGS